MEISPLMIYVIGFVDKLEIFFESVLWLGFVAGPILLIGSIPDDDSPNVDRKKIASWFKCVFATMIISAICSIEKWITSDYTKQVDRLLKHGTV